VEFLKKIFWEQRWQWFSAIGAIVLVIAPII